MSKIAAPSKQIAIAVTVGLVVLWCVALDVLSTHTWNYGPLNFFLMLVLAGIVLGAKLWGRRVISGDTPKQIVLGLNVIAVCALAYVLYGQFNSFQSNLGTDLQSDVAMNTYMADFFAFDVQQNPYTSHAQTGHGVENAPNVTQENGQLKMFGVPYYYGYPYFPAMFLAYQPFRLIDSGPQAIRIGNGVYYLLLLAAVAWLAAILVPRGYRVLAALLSVLAFSATIGLSEEIFVFCVTDIIIALCAILGFVALRYGRYSISGALFGLSFACKLVPGGIFILLFFLWFLRRPERWKFLVPMFAVILIIVVPYLMKDPGAFLSATVLYYLTEHARGDSTALWYYLPSAIKPIFQIVGYAGVLVIIVLAAARKSLAPIGALSVCFIAGAVFVAFNRMAHLNYVWAIAPLGAVALVASALGGQMIGASNAVPSGSVR